MIDLFANIWSTYLIVTYLHISLFTDYSFSIILIKRVILSVLMNAFFLGTFIQPNWGYCDEACDTQG